MFSDLPSREPEPPSARHGGLTLSPAESQSLPLRGAGDSLTPQPRASASLCGARGTHSVCPRQKDSMLCGAAAQLTRIFSSRSAVRTKRSSGLTACARGKEGQTQWSARRLPPYVPRSELRCPRASAVSGCPASSTPVFPPGHFSLLRVSACPASHQVRPPSPTGPHASPVATPLQPSPHGPLTACGVGGSSWLGDWRTSALPTPLLLD